MLIPDNMTPVVPKSDSLNPQFSVGWLEYGQARGFVTDPARVAHPQDKPRVERVLQYVRGNFFAGEQFIDLADAQGRAELWCADKAGLRIHGTTRAQPAVVFAEHEAAALLPAPDRVYRMPIYTEVKVHRDYHVQVDRALYSIPEHLRATYSGLCGRRAGQAVSRPTRASSRVAARRIRPTCPRRRPPTPCVTLPG